MSSSSPRPILFRVAGLAAAISLIPPAAFAAPAPAPTPNEALEAAATFVEAKRLADDGRLDAASDAFRRTLELDGRDPYAHLELAKFEAYLAQISRDAEGRQQHLRAAAEAAEAARTLAPANVEVLKVFAQVSMQLGDQDPGAVERSLAAFEEVRRSDPDDLQVLTALGQLYLQRNEPAKAAEALGAAAALRPGSRMVQAMLTEALLAAGDLRRAEGALATLLELEPESAENRLRLVRLLSERGAHREAVEVLRRAPPEVAAAARVRQELARELYLLGEADEALGLVDELIAEMPSHAGLKRLRMALLSAQGRNEDAIRELRELMGEDSDERTEDVLVLSRLLERAGRDDEARAVLSRALAETPAAVVPLTMALAEVLSRHGDDAAAVATLEPLLARVGDGDRAEVARKLAELEQRAGRSREAVALLDATADRLRTSGAPAAEAAGLELVSLAVLADAGVWDQVVVRAPAVAAAGGDASIATAARGLHADGLAKSGQLDAALRLLQDADPRDASGRPLYAKRVELLLGASRDEEAMTLLAPLTAAESLDDLFFAAQVLQRAQRFSESLPILARILARDPDSTQALFLEGAALERTARRTEAVSAFERLLELVPNHAPALNYLGYMLAESAEQLDAALKLTRRAVALDPDNGAYLDSLGWTYFQLGRYDEARGHLEWAARLSRDATIYEHLGDLYRKLQDRERARDSYRLALELGSDDPAAVERKLDDLGQGL